MTRSSQPSAAGHRHKLEVLVPMPASMEECDARIAEIGACQRELERIETQMNAELAAVKDRREDEAELHRERIKGRMAAVKEWCEANRGLLTKDGAVKFYRFGAGTIGWRVKPPSVRLPKKPEKVETIIAWLREAGGRFRKFIRVKQELNKEAMLAEPELAREIPGIKIGSAGEVFHVKPFATELEETA